MTIIIIVLSIKSQIFFIFNIYNDLIYFYENIKNKTLKICSLKPLTGYNRDGYCRPTIGDYGSHLICAKKWIKDF